MTRRIDIVEVGPRDGLQNDPGELTTDQKLEFISTARRLRCAPDGIRLIRIAKSGAENG